MTPLKGRVEGPKKELGHVLCRSLFRPSSTGRRQSANKDFCLIWIWKMCNSERPRVDSVADPENKF